MPIDITSDHDDERAVTTHEASALAQLHEEIEAREEVHALSPHLADALGGPDGDIDGAPWNREEMP